MTKEKSSQDKLDKRAAALRANLKRRKTVAKAKQKTNMKTEEK